MPNIYTQQKRKKHNRKIYPLSSPFIAKIHIVIQFVFLIEPFYNSNMIKYNICLNTLLKQGISEPVFYGELVNTFKRIVGKPNFSDQFKKIIKRYKIVGYNMDIMPGC